jgi:hypothetical protein
MVLVKSQTTKQQVMMAAHSYENIRILGVGINAPLKWLPVGDVPHEQCVNPFVYPLCTHFLTFFPTANRN